MFMKIDTVKAREKFIDVVLRASRTNKDSSGLLRKTLIGLLNKIGPKNFVTLTADILKNRLRIEGCNDVRTPLKSIFAISLEELEKAISDKKYHLPEEHPISFLSKDHKDNVNKLKALNSDLERIAKGIDFTGIQGKIKAVKDYYTELDSHIRKEEEALFPALEASGMKEHPDSLREEHKKFRALLSETIEGFELAATGNSDSVVRSSKIFLEKFTPDICNHIFRETYIFYPAALEFITGADQWAKIKENFVRIK